jgi:hypothetical protein
MGFPELFFPRRSDQILEHPITSDEAKKGLDIMKLDRAEGEKPGRD